MEINFLCQIFFYFWNNYIFAR